MSKPRPRDHHALIAELQGRFHTAIADLIAGSDVSLLDFPMHPNVGDAAIWVGETAYLTRARKEVRYCSSLADLDAGRLRETTTEGPLLLHGGGNFGDIWLHHQEFREHVLERFRDRPVIQLPQSIHFRSERRADHTARAIERHPNFVLLVRDEPSLEFARRKFQCETRLCPDAAFNIGARTASRPIIEVLALLRTDEERSPARLGSKLDGLPTEDWLQENRSRNRAVAALGIVSGALRGADRARLSRFNAVARARVKRGLDQLSRGGAIVTDRLHGHILSTLLGRPQALLDNDYGKIGRFLDAFTGGTRLTHRANSLRDAVDWARAQAREMAETGRVAA
jgi:exopolysaccharide biosynthesis predicted pyruvyltransferase EpsI